MKKLICFLAFACTLCLSSCTPASGTIDMSFDESERFSVEELESAATVVVQRFEKNPHCDLLSLWYDEEISDREVKDYHATKDDPGNSIMLLSNFYAKPSAGGAYNPDFTYERWMWILTRGDAGGDWEVIDSGY